MIFISTIVFLFNLFIYLLFIQEHVHHIKSSNKYI